jgi:hypothetical protein
MPSIEGESGARVVVGGFSVTWAIAWVSLVILVWLAMVSRIRFLER